MKNIIFLIGMMSTLNLYAETYQKTPVNGIKLQKNMYASYEVINKKYANMVLDCQSFVHGLKFYENNKIVREIRMTEYNVCENAYNFIVDSKNNKLPVCMEIAELGNSVYLSNDAEIDCK